MSARYVGRKLREAHFHLYDKVLHPEYFSVWKEKRFATEHYRACVWLVEGGHVLTLATDEEAFTEVFAPLEWKLPERGHRLSFRLANAPRRAYRVEGEVFYEMDFHVSKLSRQDFLRRELEIFARESSARLFSTFSEVPKGPSLPFSLVDYVPGPDTLFIKSVHSYPEEYTFVETRSELRVSCA